MKKKRAPIKQLRETAKIANELLVKKGIIGEENLLSQISKEKDAPRLQVRLPLPPRQWTITAAQRGMFALLQEWMSLHIDSPESEQENISNFFSFVVQRMTEEEKRWKAEMKEVPNLIKKVDGTSLIGDVFSSLSKKQTASGLNKFFVDSFAISVIVKQNTDVTSYADWFLNEWTPSLYKIWDKKKIYAHNDKKEV